MRYVFVCSYVFVLLSLLDLPFAVVPQTFFMNFFETPSELFDEPIFITVSSTLDSSFRRVNQGCPILMLKIYHPGSSQAFSTLLALDQVSSFNQDAETPGLATQNQAG